MELGFCIGFGFWLTILAAGWWQLKPKQRIDPLRVIVSAIVVIGIPTFWGGVIEWAVA